MFWGSSTCCTAHSSVSAELTKTQLHNSLRCSHRIASHRIDRGRREALPQVAHIAMLRHPLTSPGCCALLLLPQSRDLQQI
ncbi:hypothetical protein M758_6G197100 [Ceratodon purpureus]|nr:hypothetical protein M758_6G197100 [Ceratodon purpureus]